MKRFTQTDKWRDCYFRELSPDAKLAFLYIVDNCDGAGVWSPDYRLANFSIKKDIPWPEVLEEIGDRVIKLGNQKLWVPRFVFFQCGLLRPECPPHRTIMALLERHGIALDDPWITGKHNSEDEIAKMPERKPAIAELPGLERVRAPRSPDLLFEALAEIQGSDIKRLTPSAKAKLTKALSEIRSVEPDATPERVRAAAKAWGKKGYSAAATAMTIASHWAELTPAPETQKQRDDRAAMKDEITETRAKRDAFLDLSKAVPMPREDLTAEELKECRRLSELLQVLTRKQ